MTSLPSFATQSVIRLRAPLVTDHGAQVPDWDNSDRLTITGVLISPARGSEDRNIRDSVTTVKVLIAPADCDIVDSDRIEYNGTAYDIDGSVIRWVTGVLDHLEVPLRNVAG